jgi:hypothetical protein
MDLILTKMKISLVGSAIYGRRWRHCRLGDGLYGLAGPGRTQLGLGCMLPRSVNYHLRQWRLFPPVAVVLRVSIRAPIRFHLTGLLTVASVSDDGGFLTMVAYAGGRQDWWWRGVTLVGLLSIGSPTSCGWGFFRRNPCRLARHRRGAAFGRRGGCGLPSLSRSSIAFILFILFGHIFAAAIALSFLSRLVLIVSYGCYINIAG